jgi:hypothetical protein
VRRIAAFSLAAGCELPEEDVRRLEAAAVVPDGAP